MAAVRESQSARPVRRWQPLVSLGDVPLPAMLRLAQPMTDDALLRFCRANQDLQIERSAEGDLLVMSPAGGETGNKEGYLFRELDLWIERSGGGIAFNSNVGFILPDGSMRSPDAAWLSTQRWNSLSKEQRSTFLPLCPEFVIELRSPSDSASELEEKMLAWLANGAGLGWLLDPERRLAIIYRPGREPEIVLQPEFLDGEGPIAGFKLKMQRIWA